MLTNFDGVAQSKFDGIVQSYPWNPLYSRIKIDTVGGNNMATNKQKGIVGNWQVCSKG